MHPHSQLSSLSQLLLQWQSSFSSTILIADVGQESIAFLRSSLSKLLLFVACDKPSSLNSKCYESIATQAPHPIQASVLTLIFFIFNFSYLVNYSRILVKREDKDF